VSLRDKLLAGPWCAIAAVTALKIAQVYETMAACIQQYTAGA
jgi:hypothetical protein